jgi:hypothetical protein
MALELVTLKGTYFERRGKHFLPVGAHWIPAVEALSWPYK